MITRTLYTHTHTHTHTHAQIGFGAVPVTPDALPLRTKEAKKKISKVLRKVALYSWRTQWLCPCLRSRHFFYI